MLGRQHDLQGAYTLLPRRSILFVMIFPTTFASCTRSLPRRTCMFRVGNTSYVSNSIASHHPPYNHLHWHTIKAKAGKLISLQEPHQRLHLPRSRYGRPLQNRRLPRHRHMSPLAHRLIQVPSVTPPSPRIIKLLSESS